MKLIYIISDSVVHFLKPNEEATLCDRILTNTKVDRDKLRVCQKCLKIKKKLDLPIQYKYEINN